MSHVMLDKSQANRGTMNVSSSAGGVGIQLPPRFNNRRVQESPDTDFEDEGDYKDIMKDIANPTKMKADDDFSISSESSSGMDADYDGEGNLYSSPESQGNARVPTSMPNYYDPEELPSQGFLTIADEKADILFRLEVLRRQGIEPRKFSAKDDVREMRAELSRIKTHLELERSLKFSRKAMVGLTAALEFMNDKIDILDLELDGWSDQMHQAVYTQKEYDTIFEELFFKYRGKVQTPPEIRLLLAFGTSALTFHMSNVMSKKVQKSLEGDNLGGGGFGEDIMKKLMGGMGGGALPKLGPQIQQTPPQNQMPKMQTPQQQPAMNKPQFPDFFQSQQPKKEMSMPQFGMNPHVAALPQMQSTRNTDVQRMDSIDDDDISERLSDIPSDLESVPPSEFSSPVDNVIRVETSAKAVKKPRGRAAKKPAPRIIEI